MACSREPASVRLDVTDDHVLALAAPVMGLAEHREGLSGARRGPKEDAQMPALQCRCPGGWTVLDREATLC